MMTEQKLAKFSIEHERKSLSSAACTLYVAYRLLHPRFITSRAKRTKQSTRSWLCVWSLYPEIPSSTVPLAPYLFFPPFCLPSLQCNADFSQGGGMVEIGGVPWIIVEDIFTLTHFRVPFAPLKGAAAVLCNKSTQKCLNECCKRNRTNSQVSCVVSAVKRMSTAI